MCSIIGNIPQLLGSHSSVAEASRMHFLDRTLLHILNLYFRAYNEAEREKLVVDSVARYTRRRKGSALQYSCEESQPR